MIVIKLTIFLIFWVTISLIIIPYYERFQSCMCWKICLKEKYIKKIKNRKKEVRNSPKLMSDCQWDITENQVRICITCSNFRTVYLVQRRRSLVQRRRRHWNWTKLVTKFLSINSHLGSHAVFNLLHFIPSIFLSPPPC